MVKIENQFHFLCQWIENCFFSKFYYWSILLHELCSISPLQSLFYISIKNCTNYVNPSESELHLLELAASCLPTWNAPNITHIHVSSLSIRQIRFLHPWITNQIVLINVIELAIYHLFSYGVPLIWIDLRKYINYRIFLDIIYRSKFTTILISINEIDINIIIWLTIYTMANSCLSEHSDTGFRISAELTKSILVNICTLAFFLIFAY